MMKRYTIPFKKLLLQPHQIWLNQWFLLTSGDYQKTHYNTMTVAWGSLGIMWNKPFSQVVVRPTRFTYQFMEQYDTFTLCAFPSQFKKALQLLGTKSGRDGDKIKESGLTVIPSRKVPTPAFEEAELIIECKKIYWQDFDPTHFLDISIESAYPHKDYHRIYFGEIIHISGTQDFSSTLSNIKV
jgi:flavin reductase (DIM6/NTAB) family NADH-FMN oxidoreductase RutF